MQQIIEFELSPDLLEIVDPMEYILQIAYFFGEKFNPENLQNPEIAVKLAIYFFADFFFRLFDSDTDDEKLETLRASQVRIDFQNYTDYSSNRFKFEPGFNFVTLYQRYLELMMTILADENDFYVSEDEPRNHTAIAAVLYQPSLLPQFLLSKVEYFHNDTVALALRNMATILQQNPKLIEIYMLQPNSIFGVSGES